MPDIVEITLSPRPEFLGAVRHVFSALGRLTELSADGVEDLKLAVTEAATNGITRIAGADGVTPADSRVRIVTTREPGGLRVEVSDSGPAVDVAALDRDEAEPSSQGFSFETGLSLPLIRGLVEDLQLEAGAAGGLVVRFWIPAEADSA